MTFAAFAGSFHTLHGIAPSQMFLEHCRIPLERTFERVKHNHPKSILFENRSRPWGLPVTVIVSANAHCRDRPCGLLVRSNRARLGSGNAVAGAGGLFLGMVSTPDPARCSR